MKARLFIVNKDTIINTLDSMEVSVLVPEPKGKSGWYETLTDIISDLMQVEIGDYIFLWEAGTKIFMECTGLFLYHFTEKMLE